MLEIDTEELAEMIRKFPDAFRAGGESHDCPECGLPMAGAKTDDGPWCPQDHD